MADIDYMGGSNVNIADATGTTNKAQVNSDNQLRVTASSQTSILVSTTSVGTSATAIPASALSDRKVITIQNTSSTDVYIGHSGVTTSTGILLPKNSDASITIEVTDDVTVYGIVSSGTATVRALEVS